MCESLKNEMCHVCGKEHKSTVKEVVSGKGAIKNLADFVKNHKKVFLLADKNTFDVAGEKVINILNENNIAIQNIYFMTMLWNPTKKQSAVPLCILTHHAI